MKNHYASFSKYIKNATLSLFVIGVTSTSVFSQCFNLTSSSVNVSCNGMCDGLASVKAIGGSGTFNYSWNIGATTASINKLCPGTYTVTVIDAVNTTCTTTTSFVITEPSALISQVIANDATCGQANGSALVAVTGGTPAYMYSWNTGATSPTINNLVAGLYSLTVTDASACVSVVSATIQDFTTNLTVTTKDASCGPNNGVATVIASDGTAPYTFSWSTGASSQGSSNTLSNMSPGSYTVTVIDASGCSKSAVAVISSIPGPQPVITVNKNLLCFGESNGVAVVTNSGGTAPMTYSWSTTATGATADKLSAGTYSVTATDANACMGITSVVFSQSSQIKLTTTSASPSCAFSNGSAVVFSTGGTPSYTYSWSTGSTTNTISNLAAGVYSVTVTDNNSCFSTTSIVLQTANSPSVTTSATPATCGIANGAITSTVTGGTSPYTYSWSNGNTTATITDLQAGTYTLTVTGAQGCKAIISAIVNCVTGIANESNPLFVNIMPNPSNGIFTIDGNFENSDIAIISLTSILGETVMLIDNVHQARAYKKQVNVEHLPSGIYFLVIQQNNERLVKKVVFN